MKNLALITFRSPPHHLVQISIIANTKMLEERIFQPEFDDSKNELENEPESLGSILRADSDCFCLIEDDFDESPKIIKPSGKKALLEFRCKVEDAIQNKDILDKVGGKKPEDSNIMDITIWGIPLLPSKGHAGTDIILTKFLAANDFKVSDAFEGLKKTLNWRREMAIEEIMEEKFDSDMENLGYINGLDNSGRPLCYCLYGQFRDKEFCKKIFATEESMEELLRWRIQFIEKCIQRLAFKPGEPDSILQIIDLKNTGPAIKHLRSVVRKWLFLVQEHYPGLVFKTIVIYVPLWVFAFHTLHLKFLTPRSKRKLVLVRHSRVTETLLKFIIPQKLPVQYGGLKRENDNEFSEDDKILEQSFRSGATDSIEIYVGQAGETVIWETSIVGNEVSYKEEFVPDDECSYNVLLMKEKRILSSVRNSFHIREPGKIVITIENKTYKRKRIYYRYKTTPTNVPCIFN